MLIEVRRKVIRSTNSFTKSVGIAYIPNNRTAQRLNDIKNIIGKNRLNTKHVKYVIAAQTMKYDDIQIKDLTGIVLCHMG